MSVYVTIDGGTTNTRLTLTVEGKAVQTERVSLGARTGIDDREALPKACGELFRKLLNDNGLAEADVTAVIASGMLGSEFGLYEVPHLIAPAGLKELHDSMLSVVLPAVTDLPIHFIRGVKCLGESFAETDMMRGEETELIGLSEALDPETVYILPGSHSKLVVPDKERRINVFATLLTGEMVYALSKDTILKDAVDLSIEDLNEEALLNGYDFALKEGLNKALFKTRILKNLFKKDAVYTYSYFLGAVLSGELSLVSGTGVSKAVLAGRASLRRAMVCILKNRTEMQVSEVEEETAADAPRKGAIRVFEYID